ncbi:MAG TPA: CYTH domain-containing protein [Candidatus Eremiobacteraeota bacterium]|nr:CYTH domain-containing protein [Candidatus Eremiobacteraeota bacterium]
MNKEIERKFLLKNDSWREGAEGITCRQGYLSTVKERTIRVRTIDEKGFLTIKGVSVGASRAEYEYEIPGKDAYEILTNLCEKPLIEKKRYKISYKGLIWEIDEFFGDNKGLIMAEVELTDEKQSLELPSWVGEEVTGKPEYFNSNLIKYPYSKW